MDRNGEMSHAAKRFKASDEHEHDHAVWKGRNDDDNHDEALPGPNRAGADFSEWFANSDGQDQSNYSITYRWRNRSTIWKTWMDKCFATKDFDIARIHPPTKAQLFLTNEDVSPLGKALTSYCEAIEECKASIEELRRETDNYNTEIDNYNTEIENYGLEIEQQEAEERTLTTELFDESVTIRQGMSQLVQSLIEEKKKGIEKNKKLIEMNKKGIEKNKKLIEMNKKGIAKNKNDIEKHKKLIEMEKEKIKTDAGQVQLLIQEILQAHVSIRTQFSVIKSKGNESLITVTSKMPSLDKRRFDDTKLPSPSPVDEFFNPTKNSVEVANSFIEQLSNGEKHHLKLFQEFLIKLFVQAKETSEKEMVNATIDAIINWKSGVSSLDKTKKYARPPTDQNQETTTDQPILQAVICRICGILVDKDATKAKQLLGAQEQGVTTEQRVAGSNEGNTRSRKIDITVSPREEHLAVVLPTMVKKAIEIKVVRKKPGQFYKMLEKGRSQIIGHLGKRLLHYFDFAGSGRDGTALGVSLTLLSVEVIKMELNDVGKKTVSLEMSTTECAPLLDRESISAHEKKFGAKDINGMLLLAGALKHGVSDNKFITESSFIKQTHPKKEDLTVVEYLGSGAFSNVVRLDKERGEFMKMPKEAAMARSLEQEAEILKALQSGKEGPLESIPSLSIVAEGVSGVSGLSTLLICFRGEISTMIGLRLRGVIGLPLGRLPLTYWANNAPTMIRTVYQALKFAHSKNIYHLDVRPGNIIIDVSGQPWKVMLADWGCSVDGNKQKSLKGFHGCTPYAHDRLLGNFSGRLGADLDFASLTYTFHHLVCRELKWSFDFDRPSNVSEGEMKYRREVVHDWLVREDEEQKVVPRDILDDLKNATGTCSRSIE